jgi:hypothetical protein
MAGPDNASFPHEHQDQSQQANTDTTSSSIAHAEPQTFEATTAVLDTNELLHLIISAVPREYRTSLRRVSKNWQAAVLRIGHVFEPIDHDHYLYDWAVADGFYGLGSVYALEDKFALNPVLRCSSRTHDSRDPDYELSHDVDFVTGLSLTELTGRKHQFISDPPMSHLMIHAEKTYERGEVVDCHVANLCVRGGIRIGDLIEYFEKLDGLLPMLYKYGRFAVRYYFNESDCEMIWLDGSEEGGDDQVEVGDRAVGGDGEIEAGRAG